MTEIDSMVRHKLKRFVRELKGIRGLHTELVTVYIPAGYELIKIIQHLQQEQGTASNIKDKTNRQNVVDSLERMVRHLRLFKSTPPNGLAVFSGNIASQEGKQDIKVWSIEPPVPLNIRMYRCDKTFITAPLEDIVAFNETFGLIVMDNREGTVGFLKGKSIQVIKEMHSAVPGKFKAGGQCLASDTLVQLHNGLIIPISEMHNPMAVKSYDFNNDKMLDSGVSAVWKTKKEAYTIETSAPHLTITASADHKFFVSRAGNILELPLKELSEKDLLLMPEKIEIDAKPFLIDNTFNYEYKILDSGRKIIKEIREEKGLFQKELAKRIDVYQATISAFELGKINFLRETLVKLCNELGIDFFSFVHNHCKPISDVKLPIVLDKKCAQITGYFFGDGNFEGEDRLGFSEENEFVANIYAEMIKEYFNTNVGVKFRASKNYYQIRVYGRPVVRFFRNNFAKKNALKNSVPPAIMTSPDFVVAGFLKGIFDAEGYVTKDEVAIGMMSKRIINEINLLLLRFGILSSISVYNNKKNPYSSNFRYTLRITDKTSLERFVKNIGFSSFDKQNKAVELSEKRTDVSRTRQILCNGSEIRKILSEYGYSLKDFPTVSDFFRDKKPMSKIIFEKRIVNKVKDNNLKKILRKILNNNLIPVKINSIKKSENIIEMNDITVNNANFIAQGLVVHNSQQRFARLREDAANEFYHRIADVVNHEFLPLLNDLKGILIGGPGMTKEIFLNGNYINNELKKKVIAVRDLGYTGDYGMHELVERSQDALAEQEITKEKKIVQELLTLLATNSDKVVYGVADVKKALGYGAVDKLLLSEDFEGVDELEDMAEATKTKIFIISTETKEGVQLRDLGGAAAILRYSIVGFE